MVQNEQFTRCWTQAQPVVAAYIGSLVPDFHAAEDLLQTVAIKLHRKFGDYDPSRPFVAWALGFARLEVLNLQRTQARSFLTYCDEALDAVEAAHIELAPELSCRAAALRECLQRVGGRSREMLRLRYEEELKPHHIAARLAMGAVAVRVALSRVRGTLRDCIERRVAAGGGAG